MAPPPSNRLRWAVAALALVVLAVALGPRERFDDRWVEPDPTGDLDEWLAAREARVPGIRAGDQKAIVWADPVGREATPIAVVYLHGFSADRHEIEPVLTDLASEMGFNVFFTRLRGHGRDGPAMAEAAVEGWLDDTAEAVAIGSRIGERVVVMGTSTGGTLATWAANRPEAVDRIDGVVLVSPNYQPRDRSSRVLLYPWGSVIAGLVLGEQRCFTPENDDQARHWTTCYPTSALSTMMALVEHVRTMDVTAVRAPTLVLYDPADQVVDPTETERVIAGLVSTSPTLYQVRSSSDPAHHVLAGDIISPASSNEVASVLRSFLVTLSNEPAPVADRTTASSARVGRLAGRECLPGRSGRPDEHRPGARCR